MNGLLYCKNKKPYLLSSNYRESELYYYTKRTDEKNTLMLSTENRFKYVSKNGKLVGTIEFEYLSIDLDKMSDEEKEKLEGLSKLTTEEIQQRLKNEKLGLALYVKNIDFYSEEKDLSDHCTHKFDRWTKTINEEQLFDPKSDKKVFLKGEFKEENFKYLIVLSSQEIYDIIHKNISVIIRNKFKI